MRSNRFFLIFTLLPAFLVSLSSVLLSYSSLCSTLLILNSVDSPQDLTRVKRIYVDSFGDSIDAQQIQAMVISALVRSNLFQITENKASADAILKGSARELSSKELQASSEETTKAAAAINASTASAGNISSGNAAGAAASQTQKDATFKTETIYNARLAVRLVNDAGDIIWATTQDTRGSKYTTATADLADKLVTQLIRDLERLNPGAAKSRTLVPPKGAANTRIIFKSMMVTVEGDRAMEAEINKKLLSWGKLALVSGSGKSDLALEVTQTGKFDMMRTGSAVTAAAVLRDSESGDVIWSTTKGGFWSMSGASTRQVGGQIANDLIKFLDSVLKSR